MTASLALVEGKNLGFISVSVISNKLEVTTKDIRIINLAFEYTLPLPSGEPSGIVCLLCCSLSCLHYSTALLLLNGFREPCTAAASSSFYLSSLCDRKKKLCHEEKGKRKGRMKTCI
jgi:hypothetical protein